MELKLYLSVVRKCNILLRKWYDNKYILANHLLHINSSHPTKIHNFYSLYNDSSLNVCSTLIKNLFKACLFPIYKIFHRPLSFPKSLKSSKDILVISHLIKPISDREDEDFYFGKLLSENSKANNSILGCLINHLGYQISESKAFNIYDSNSIVLPKRITLTHEYKIILIQLFNTIKWLFLAFTFKSQNKRRLIKTLAIGFLSQESINALRISEQVRILIFKYKFKKVVLTWEGLAWERLVIHTIVKKHPDIETVAFQHSVLVPSVNALLNNIPHANPKRMVTINTCHKSFLETRLKFKTFIDISGIPRLNLVQNAISTRNRISSDLRVLVTPEGLGDECVRMFNFVENLAKEFKAIKFTFRFHPIYPYESFVRDYPKYINLPSNCFLSANAELSMDLLESDILLYRGSTTSLSAVLKGVLPIYIRMEEEEMSINPLFLLKGTYQEIKDINDFNRIIIDANLRSRRTKGQLNTEAEIEKIFFKPYDFNVFLK